MTFFLIENNLGNILPNITATIQTAAEILRAAEITEPRREAQSLLALTLQKDQAFLIAHPEYELTEAEEKRFDEFLKRRAGREPFQHIAGRQEFYGLDFAVSKDVLIPRPETELLVENAISILEKRENPRICEIGVGSGCIAVAVLHNVKTARCVGLDISAKALAIAGQNALTHGVRDRLELKISDVFDGWQNDPETSEDRFDLIVSNPPYVPADQMDGLQPEVRRFDPVIALTDGRDGLSIIGRIIRDAPGFLKPEGFLLLEIGFNQAERVREMFAPEIWTTVEIRPDLQGIPRMVVAQKERRQRG